MSYESLMAAWFLIIVIAFSLVVIVLTILLPFFVLKIRNQMILLNENVAKILVALGAINKNISS
ncbi:MAG: hypothetical protein JSW35_00890 [Deltaproteobacteria bacterium]|nr:MAG: hypothetical protein JSW35_00890 [Deltaproteobacteria bacterium]